MAPPSAKDPPIQVLPTKRLDVHETEASVNKDIYAAAVALFVLLIPSTNSSASCRLVQMLGARDRD